MLHTFLWDASQNVACYVLILESPSRLESMEGLGNTSVPLSGSSSSRAVEFTIRVRKSWLVALSHTSRNNHRLSFLVYSLRRSVWSKTIRIYARTWSTRRFSSACASMDFLAQPTTQNCSLLLRRFGGF